MKTFLIVSLAVLATISPFIIVYFVANWKRLIWGKQGESFPYKNRRNLLGKRQTILGG